MLVCGCCGTTLNEGYTTCPSCKAVYKTAMTPAGRLCTMLAWIFVLVGVGALPAVFMPSDVQAALIGVCIAAFGVAFFLFRSARRTRHPVWSKPGPDVRIIPI
jgi:hypothetical protein